MPPPLFPTFPGVNFPVVRRGPIFDTLVQDSISGKQAAYPQRATPKWAWEIGFDVLRSRGGFDEMAVLAGFVAGRYGRALPFAYADSEDNAASNQLFGSGDGVATDFQLVRTRGGFTEPVLLPAGTPVISAGGTPLAAGLDYTIGDGGGVTFAVAPDPGAPLTWSGGFNWLCRFDEDDVGFAQFMSGLWRVEKLAFTSVIA